MEYGIKIVKRYRSKSVLAVLACLPLLVLPCAQGGAKTWPKPKVPNVHVKASKDTETRIRTVLMMSNENVYDYNKDGEMNCTDHLEFFLLFR